LVWVSAQTFVCRTLIIPVFCWSGGLRRSLGALASITCFHWHMAGGPNPQPPPSAHYRKPGRSSLCFCPICRHLPTPTPSQTPAPPDLGVHHPGGGGGLRRVPLHGLQHLGLPAAQEVVRLLQLQGARGTMSENVSPHCRQLRGYAQALEIGRVSAARFANDTACA
jgi:hypothetical protein